MYKHIALLVRKQEMNHDEFVDYWQHNHTPIAREIEGVVRYQTVLPADADAAEFDGIAELYFDDLNALHDALGSEGSRDYDPAKGKAKEARDDVDNFLDIERRPRLIGEEFVEKDETDGDTTGLYKHSAFLVRKDGMTHEEFLDHWANEHVPLAREIPGVVRYARVVPTDPEHAEFDGVAELYFESLDALRTGLGHESSRDYDPDHPKAKAPREDVHETLPESREPTGIYDSGDVDNFLSLEDRPRFVGQETVQKDVTGE